MNKILRLVFLIACIALGGAAQSKIVPDDIYVPEDQLLKMESVPAEYFEIFNQVKNIFSNELKQARAQLEIKFDLDSTRPNAFVTREGNSWLVTFQGGMIRHQLFNRDLFSSVLCHEMGHHLGGEPFKYPDHPENFWVSTEGQADYFTTNVCLKRLYSSEDNSEYPRGKDIGPHIKRGCEVYNNTPSSYHLCLRNAYLSVETAMFSYRLTWGRRGPRFKVPVIDEPDETVVSVTKKDHPEPQCRLDTFFQGSLCPVEASRADTMDYRNCHEADSRDPIFVVERPKCWFAGE